MSYPACLDAAAAAVAACRACTARGAEEIPFFAATPTTATARAPDILLVTSSPYVHRRDDFMAALADSGIAGGRVRHAPLMRCGEQKAVVKDCMAACGAHVLAEIAALRPTVVLAVGPAAEGFFYPAPKEETTADEDDDEPHHSDPVPVPRIVVPWRHPQDPTNRPQVVVVGENPNATALKDAVAAVAYFADVDGRRPPADTGRRPRPLIKPPPGCAFVGATFRGSEAYLWVRGQDGSVSSVRASSFVPEFRHYFLLWSGDLATEQAKASFVHITETGATHGRRRIVPAEVRNDPHIPAWFRVYVDLPDTFVTKFDKALLPEEQAYYHTTISPALRLAKLYETAGIRTFEADLDPVRRFLTDYEVEFADDLRIGCLDIETDDSSGRPVAEIIGKVRVLSIAIRDSATKEDLYAATAADTDEAEYALLYALFTQVFPKFDLIYAWNGGIFDWPFLFARARFYGLTKYLPGRVYWDSLLSFKKHHAWDAESKAGYSLDNVSRVLLGEGKVERGGSVKGLWLNDRPRLAQYNVGDVDRTERIERKTGYVAADLALNRLANCPPDTTYVSFRVDGLALAEGYLRGTHYPTKFMRPDGADDEKYHGAYVLAPVAGVHDDVANFDFASLYPSVFTSFNVSPDSYLPPAEAARMLATDPTRVTVCPKVTLDDGAVVGGSCFIRGPLGVIPSVYDRVAKQRAKWKKEAARHVPNSPEYLAARRMEYAYKTLGLSMYGVMGSIFSRFYQRDVAEAVTLTAQFLIRLTMEAAKRQGNLPLYGDTDSVFIAIRQEAVPAFLKYSALLYAALAQASNCAANLIELEYEQFFSRIVLIGKKRYFGRLVVQKGKACDALEVKGLELRRSDGLAALRRLQTDLVLGLAHGTWSEATVLQWALAVKDRLFSGGFGADDLKVTGGVQKALDQYAGATPDSKAKPPPHVVVARRLQAAGREIYVGTKIAYIVLNGLRGVQAAEAVEEWSGSYDPVYYWCNKLWPGLARVLKVALPKVDWSALDDVWYPKLKNKLQTITVRSVGSLAEWKEYSSSTGTL